MFMIMYLLPKFSHVDLCTPVKSTKFWDFVAGMDFAAGMDNVPDIWFLPKQQCSTHILWKQLLQYLSDCNYTKMLAKNSFKISFFFFFFFCNFKLPLEIFQNKFEFWFLVNLCHSLEHYEPWKDEESKLIFFMAISITLSLQIKKIQISKYCPHGFLWPQSVKVLRFCGWYGHWHLINFEQNVSNAWFSPKQ